MTNRLMHGLVRSCNNRCTTLFVPHVAAYPAGRVPSDQNRINFWRRENQRWSYPRPQRRRSFLFPRHPLAFLACLGERDGDRLFAAFHPAALSTLAAFRRAPLITVHLASHFLAGAPRVFSFPFLSHSSLLTKVPVKVIQRPPAVLSAPVREPDRDAYHRRHFGSGSPARGNATKRVSFSGSLPVECF